MSELHRSNVREKFDLPIVQLLDNKARRAVLQFAMTEMNSEKWYRTGEIADHVSVSRESVRGAVQPLTAFGILDVRGEDANIPHRRVAQTPVVDLIQQWERDSATPSLFAVFPSDSSDSVIDLMEFFLDIADPSESYSFNQIGELGDVTNQTASRHIDTLIDAGIVETVDGTRATEYRVNEESPFVQFLVELNEAAAVEYDQRM